MLSGLSKDERDIVERAFRLGAVKVLAATSTLAAGVNLPCRRVIFRQAFCLDAISICIRYRDSPPLRQAHKGKDMALEPAEYAQMCGRAGRSGIDEYGEAFLLQTAKSKKDVLVKLLQAGFQVGN